MVKGGWRDEDLLLQLLLELVLIASRTHLLLFLTDLLFLRLILQWLLIFCFIIIITLTNHSLIFIPDKSLILIIITLPLRLSIISFFLPLKHQLLLSIRLILAIRLNHFHSHVIDNFLLVNVCYMPCAEIHSLHELRLVHNACVFDLL